VGLASRLGCALALSAALAAPAGAQIPGAHYTGTTADNYPISFDVSGDGTSLTNVVTTYNYFCTSPGPATIQQRSVNSTFAFPINGGTISGRDNDGSPVFDMAGTFTGQQAAGTFSGYGGGFTYGTPYFCNALERKWNASTTAALPGGGNPGGGNPGGTPGGDPGGDPGGGDPVGGNPGGAAAGKPAVTVSFPSGVLLKPSLSNGFVVGITLDQPAGLSGKVVLSAKDAKKYGLGKKAITVSKASTPLGGTDSSLEFRFSKAIAKKLKKAKKLKLVLVVTATNATGDAGIATQTLSFK
jgi:hypothetical protein